MVAAQCFEYLYEKAEKLTLPSTEKAEIMGLIHSLKQEALSHEDRRSHDYTIKKKWQTLVHLAKGSRLFVEPEDFMDVVRDFVGESSVNSFFFDRMDHFDNWNEIEFLSFLERDLSNRKFITGKNHLIIYLGVKYLYLESCQTISKRDQKSILKVWKMIKPILDEYGMLKQFKRSEKLRNRIQNFINGKVSKPSHIKAKA